MAYTGETSGPSLPLNDLLHGSPMDAELVGQLCIRGAAQARGAERGNRLRRHLDPLAWVGRSVAQTVQCRMALVARVVTYFQVR